MEFYLSCGLTVLWYSGILIILLMDILCYFGDDAADNTKVTLPV